MDEQLPDNNHIGADKMCRVAFTPRGNSLARSARLFFEASASFRHELGFARCFVTKEVFLATILEQGFTEHEIPAGLRDCHHTQLYRHEDSEPFIYVEAYYDGDTFKNYPGKNYFLMLRIGGMEVFRKVSESSNDDDFSAWFHRFAEERDGILYPHEIEIGNRAIREAIENIVGSGQ